MALIDFILHIDSHMVSLVQQYGVGIYPILFAIGRITISVINAPKNATKRLNII